MALIDKDKTLAEIERLEKIDYPCDNYEQSVGFYDALDRVKSFLDTIPEQTVNLPKWQKLKNINSYSDRKTWKDDKVLFVADSEGYLYGCSIRELFDKLPKEE